MANGPALSTGQDWEIYIGNEIRDSLCILDVLYANHYEEESFDQVVLEHREVNFYRGAPPDWLNFHISEQAELNGTGTSFIKRDGYDTLVQQVHQRRKRPGTSTVKLFHQPGSGGTTLAMQVLWDLRKKLRCAVLTGSTSDLSDVAKEVVDLFTAGDRNQQNTVLLLVNDEHILENLQDSIMKTIAEMQIDTYKHVAVLLSCVRKEEVLPGENVSLKQALSDTEKQQFKKKKGELSRRFTDEHEHFHGFNIMQNNFSEADVQKLCTAFSKVQRTNRPKKTQLAAFLSLLNAYVPGSYLLESQCLDFLKYNGPIDEDYSLVDIMKPFSHLIVTFWQNETSEKRVGMAHHMIAQQCIKQMAKGGVTRSDTARNFLTCFCREKVPPWLLGFVKDMLTKREMKKEENPGTTEMKDEQERFSRLILDIQKTEHAVLSASVLKVASNKFDQNPYFPQALARVCYIELKEYNQAEKWAKTAKERDPQNSFIADTLGQVYKNHLNYLKSKKSPITPREILQLATKAIEAFKHEERLAENEHGPEMKGDGMAKISNVFNNRGQFGYLQVCNILYDFLVDQNKIWREVLTRKVSMCSVLKALGDNKLYRFNDLISSLRDEVERKCAFFDKYLTYSKPDMNRDDAPYISRDISDCYKKYVGESPPKHLKEKCAIYVQKLKQLLAETSAGVLSCLDRKYTESELKEITTWWEEIYTSKDSLTALGNYFLAHIILLNMGVDSPSKPKYVNTFKQKIPLSPKEAPELHMLALLLHWPTDSEDKCIFNLTELVENMHCSYEHAYKRYFRSRYLHPLFFIGKGQFLKRFVHRKVLQRLFLEQNNEEIQDWSNWSDEKILKDLKIQNHLLRVEGVVRNYGLYATIGGREIEVDANLRRSLWKSRQVSFYLGFTIRGPVAFDIQTKLMEKVEVSWIDVSKPGSPGTTKRSSERMDVSTLGAYSMVTKQDSSDWTKLTPDVTEVDKNHTFSLQSEGGRYECSVSTLRWMCKDKVQLQYHFCSWEEHKRKPVCTNYMPAGPLLDIKVIAGKLEEVHLPHWIDYNSKMSHMFAVLHVDTCGDFVEQVSEVTSSHVKILQPSFSPWGVVLRTKLGFPVKVFCEAIIFKTRKEFLTLHVHLVPPDGNLQQRVERTETSQESVLIQKHNPEQSLQMLDHYFLTADTDKAEIQPKKLPLSYEMKNFFEVFIRDADNDFTLKLESERRNSEQNNPWTCTIRKGDYKNQTPHHAKASGDFIERHFSALIENARNTPAILDQLMEKKFISPEEFNTVLALQTSQRQMREILNLVKRTKRGKKIFYEIINGMESMRPLITELEKS